MSSGDFNWMFTPVNSANNPPTTTTSSSTYTTGPSVTNAYGVYVPSSNPQNGSITIPGTLTGTPNPSTTGTYTWPNNTTSGQYQIWQSTELLRIQTPSGPIIVKPDGKVEYPADLQESAQEFWDWVAACATKMIQAEVRKIAARKVKELLPELLPELGTYEKQTIPNAIAMAIAGD